MQTNALHTEKKLLCLLDCGCYISTHDIVKMAHMIGIELPFKKRSFVLQSLFHEAHKNNREQGLLAELCALLESKKEALSTLVTLYPSSLSILESQLHKIEATKHYYEREFSLHVKEVNHES